MSTLNKRTQKASSEITYNSIPALKSSISFYKGRGRQNILDAIYSRVNNLIKIANRERLNIFNKSFTNNIIKQQIAARRKVLNGLWKELNYAGNSKSISALLESLQYYNGVNNIIRAAYNKQKTLRNERDESRQLFANPLLTRAQKPKGSLPPLTNANRLFRQQREQTAKLNKALEEARRKAELRINRLGSRIPNTVLPKQ